MLVTVTCPCGSRTKVGRDLRPGLTVSFRCPGCGDMVDATAPADKAAQRVFERIMRAPARKL